MSYIRVDVVRRQAVPIHLFGRVWTDCEQDAVGRAYRIQQFPGEGVTHAELTQIVAIGRCKQRGCVLKRHQLSSTAHVFDARVDHLPARIGERRRLRTPGDARSTHCYFTCVHEVRADAIAIDVKVSCR